MPLGLDPEATYPFVLKSDEEKPESDRPTFLFHFLTRRDRRKVTELIEQFRAMPEDDVEGLVAKLTERVLVGLVGWRNVTGRDGKPIPFAPATLPDILTTDELVELAVNYPAAGVLAERSKKASASPSSSSTANSAEPAETQASA